MLKHVGMHQRGLRCVCEVMAGAGALEGHVGCVWDGDGTLRGGQECQRGWGFFFFLSFYCPAGQTL